MIRAMPERKRFFAVDPFPKINCIGYLIEGSFYVGQSLFVRHLKLNDQSIFHLSGKQKTKAWFLLKEIVQQVFQLTSSKEEVVGSQVWVFRS